MCGWVGSDSGLCMQECSLTSNSVELRFWLSLGFDNINQSMSYKGVVA